MVAGEEKLLPVKKNDVSAGVAGCRYGQQIGAEFEGCFAFKDLLHPEPCRAILRVHHSGATKLFPEALVIGNVIAVSQEHLIDAAQLLDSFYELRGKAW